MTIGEHLEELRGCLVRSLIAFVVACAACIYPARYLLEIIARPVILVLRARGQPDSFLATGPVESLLVYIKVVVIFALIISGPYVIYQLWGFVDAGLYKHERQWVRTLVPVSIGLFATGVAFMYVFVLVGSLNFLVGFSNWLPLPDAKPTALERALLHMPAAEGPTTQPGSAGTAAVPLLNEDPNHAPPGSVWVNVQDGKLRISGTDGKTYSIQVLRDDQHGMVTTHFKIGEYLSFVLILTIAFGLAFQTPLVVLFLARSGLIPVEVLRKYRKVVILVIVFIAGILAPPDILSHLMLSGPMVLLFELGLFFAARQKPPVEEKSAETSA